MNKYDDLFDDTAPEGAIFADKGVLDPLADPDEIVARDDQEREIATILNGVNEGYLPPTVSVYGPPGTGKTLTTRRVCREFAARHDEIAVEYVNLKECRSLFSAANEILFELTGEKKGAYEGLDGVFEGIWEALEDYPAWTVLSQNRPANVLPPADVSSWAIDSIRASVVAADAVLSASGPVMCVSSGSVRSVSGSTVLLKADEEATAAAGTPHTFWNGSQGKLRMTTEHPRHCPSRGSSGRWSS